MIEVVEEWERDREKGFRHLDLADALNQREKCGAALEGYKKAASHFNAYNSSKIHLKPDAEAVAAEKRANEAVEKLAKRMGRK
ncbi:hypothetical protein COX85_03115 [Candidatus Micrarchaeota archaeon CG_4_10_14_0_2_um_filter_55_9]|nr:MAG: hypothetical protein AUJ15_02460 [Candidatus Micrarchaeota archaeon CG1_02_55_41]PIO03859.1 MAG: hypothetical protein COT57_00275 [Candidatus Micrarchaeota archaeon CG09_land_8_20_14_0_10_55_25]PIZ91581.1 MAG: hypothetical protein COX85_03115 [Candidatus Micrarchaeota archaeon CG_4_10_14_0_2_um_filter_55_9]PJD00990.1 MAG: hypothetical protein COU38_03375 [Candidatus Micrarchaeota archaeon CG10_big_fil_rev_8_21_14_0_10_54_18]